MTQHPLLQYVMDLSSDHVTARPKAALAVIAAHYFERYASANVGLDTIAYGLLIDLRWCRRLVGSIDKKILEYTPGGGPGNFSVFRFPEHEAWKENEAREQKRKESRVNGGSNGGSLEGHQLHPNKEDLDPNPSQNQNPPLIPPSPRGDKSDFRRLTGRERRQLNERITQIMENPRVDFETALEGACAELLIPLQQGRALARAAGLGDGLRKPPGSARRAV